MDEPDDSPGARCIQQPPIPKRPGFPGLFKPQGALQKAPVNFGRVSDSKKKRQKLISHIGDPESA